MFFRTENYIILYEIYFQITFDSPATEITEFLSAVTVEFVNILRPLLVPEGDNFAADQREKWKIDQLFTVSDFNVTNKL